LKMRGKLWTITMFCTLNQLNKAKRGAIPVCGVSRTDEPFTYQQQSSEKTNANNTY
jgi:hypothetical protein